MEKYQVALTMEGSAIQGKTVYENNCSICHKMGENAGHAFGPDLATLGNRRPQNLLEDILDPNLSIADSYDLWFIELQSGEQLQGTIASETPLAIQLLHPGGIERTIGRQDIKSLKVMEMSAMPVGLEENLTPQEMADLLAFIKKK
jgi:putative heme-binding domain-containing protein